MGRTQTLLLRLCIIASAVVMLVLSLRAVRADERTPALRASQISNTPDPGPADSGSVYGYNPGQGMPHTFPQTAPVAPPGPQLQQSEPQPVRLAVPQSQAPQPAQQPQPYGYRPGDGVIGVDHYGTQQPVDPQANYQSNDRGQGDEAAGPRANADYRLGPGDKLRVTVYGETDLSGEYQIDGSGVVRLPLIGSFTAAGTTAPGLEAGISAALARGYLKNPRVNVEITTYRPFYIIGAVAKPGEYPYVDHINALNAVALAGGFLDTARQSAVYVRHEGSAAEEEISTDRVTQLRPGDTLRVQTTLFWQAMQIFTPLTPALYAVSNIR